MDFISIVIAGRNDAQRKEEIEKILTNHAVSKFDVAEVEKIKPSQSKQKTLGIEDIRNAQSNMYMAPVKGSAKAVVLAADEITTEAQNALLKILEEPPTNTIIIVSIPSTQKLLPTILSRCKVVTIDAQTPAQTSDFLRIIHAPVGEKLKKAEEVGKDKEVALQYLLAAITLLRTKLYEAVREDEENSQMLKQYHTLLTKLSASYTTIANTNVSPRFTLEILLLSLS